MENKSQQTVLPDSASLDIPVTGTTTVIDAISDQALPSSNDLSLEPVTVGQSKSVRQPNSTSILLRFVRRADVLLVFIFILASILVFFLSSHHKPSQSPQASLSATSNFNTVKLPLSGLTFNQSPAESSNASVTINGPLLLNDSLQLTPSLQPTGAKPGQIYFDSSNGQLAYYNGQNFVFLSSAGPTGLQSLGGATGQVNLGSGLGINNGALSNTGVLSFQGRTGSVALTAGPGLVINGTNLSNGGVLSVSSTSPNITVTNDGSGHINLSLGALPGTGTVTSSGGNSGSIPVYTGSQNIEDSIVTQSGLGITVSGDLNVTGNVNFTNPLPVSSGGTGLSSLPLYGVLVGQGPGPVNSLTAGSSGLCLLSTSGSPIWATCPSATGGVVTSINNLNGDLTLANVSAVGNNITIDNATSTSKGIASFNGTNFSVIGGAVNTAQNIASSATPTFAGLNTNTITPSAAFTLGNTAQSFTLQGSAASELLVSNGANTTQLTFANPTANVTYRLPAANVGTYDICTSAGNCLGPVGSGANTALSNLTGVAINTSLLAGATTIDLGSRTAPFRDLYLGGTATNNFRFTGSATAARTITIPDASGTLAISASSPLSLSANGNLSITNPVAVAFGGTNANTAATARSNLSAAQSGTNNDITSLTDLTSITPSAALTVGATTQTLALQGGASTTLSATSGSFTTQLAFETPTANVTYNLQAAAAGTYDICTTAGNCLGGSGGGANTSLSNLSGVAINVSLATGNSSVDLGTATAPFRSLYLGSGSNNFHFTGTPTAARTITIPDASGTLAVSANAPLQLSASGALSCPSCLTSGGGGSGGVSSINSLNGALNLNGTTSDEISVNNNSGTGTITLSLPQGIASTSSPTFAAVNTNSIIPSSVLTIGSNAEALTLQGSSGTILEDFNGAHSTTLSFTAPSGTNTITIPDASGTLAISASSPLSLSASGNLSITNPIPIANGGTNANSAATARSNLSAAQSGVNNDITSLTDLTSITPPSTLTLGSTNQTLTLQGGASTTLSATSGSFTTQLAFGIPTANVTYNLQTAAAGSYDICTTAGNCLGGSSGGANTALSNLSGVAINVSLATGNSSVDLGSASHPFRDLYLGGTTTNNFHFTGSATAARTITIPDNSGTLAVAASGNIALSGTGNLTITGQIPLANGGTGTNNTYNQYGVIYSNSANFVSTAAGSSGQCLVGQNSAAPTWTSCATGTNITLQAAYNMSGSTPLITTTASNKGFVLQAGSGSNSTSLFGANNANGASLFSVDSVNSIVNLFSNSSATGNDTGTWTTNGTNLYASLYYASSVTANGYIYEIGGYTSSAATANVYYAPLNSNGSVGSWTQTSSLPAAEGSCKAVTANGYIYDLCGTVTFYAGINSNGTLTSWSTSSSVLPGGSYAGETTANGYLYVNTGNTTNLIYSAALHADGSIGAWTQTGSAGALSVTISGSPGTFIANGYLYMIGGATSSPAGWTGGAAGTCYYAKLGSNGTVGAWSGCTSSMTFGRAAATTVVENGYVYVIDGYQDYAGTTTYPNSTLYAKLGSSGDITSWNTSANALPAFRQYSTSVVANGYIYELGGYDSGGTTQNSVYYASTNRVQVASSLDLTGSVGQGLVPGNSDASGGGEGGSLTADNGTFVGSLQVEGQSNLEGSANVNGTLMVRPTVDSTSAFQVQNASGGSLLNVDTTNGLIGVENLSPLLSTVTQPTITTIDPTDTYGQFSATAIGQDGFARIAYGHNGAGGLKFAQCTNDACTSPNITTVESANQALATSIAIGNDGYARIAYWVNGTGLEYAQCTNAACTTSNITTVDNNNSQTGEYNSIAIGPDGYPRISYIDGVNRYLKFAQCLNDACTSTNITNVDTSGNIANGGTSLAMGTDGFARIAYYNSQAPSSQKVEYAICLNATCSSNNKFAMTSTGTTTQYAVRLALSATNVPYVAYQNSSGLYDAVCNLASCSTGFTTTTVDSSTAGVDYLSIVIGADGYPRIAYNDSAANGGEIKLASCTPSCSITVIDAGPDAGSNTPVSLYLTSDERAHITYFNGLTLQLKFAIQNTPAAEATLGSNIGSSTNYFNQAYLSRINLQGALLINNTGRTATPAIQITGGGSSYFSATDSVGGLNLSVSSSAFLFRDSSDNTSAFQIQNAGNVGLFTVDTQNSILTLGGPTNNVTFNNATSALTLNGNARHTEVIMLTPEYAGAVLDTGATGNNTGTMTSGLDLTNRKNYYLWTTTQATSQSYDVVVQVPIPSNFSAWASTTPLTIDAETGDTTNGTIQVEVRDTSGAVESANNFLGITPSSTNTWQTMTAGAFTGTYTSGGYMTLRIRMYSTSAVTNGVKVGNITLSYLSKW